MHTYNQSVLSALWCC